MKESEVDEAGALSEDACVVEEPLVLLEPEPEADEEACSWDDVGVGVALLLDFEG